MKTFLIATTGLLLTTSSLLAAPDVVFHDMLFSARSEVLADDQAAGLSDDDLEHNVGMQWATAYQHSLANASVATGASVHAHSAIEGTPTEKGFRIWGYTSASTYSMDDQASNVHSSGGGHVGFTLDRPMRVTGEACAFRDRNVGADLVHTMIFERVPGQDVLVHFVYDAMDPGDCLEFEMILQPGEYEAGISSLILVENNGDGQLDDWAEASMELAFENLANPDVDFDGDVDGSDLAKFLGAWGTTMPEYDFNGDYKVDGGDLSLLLGAWTG